MGVLRNIDTGRGIFAFGLFLVITVLTPFIDGFLTFGYNGMAGGQWILHAFTGNNGIFYCAVLGLVISFILQREEAFGNGSIALLICEAAKQMDS